MKKLLVLSALCAALSASAAPKKLATVQIADATSCVSAITKLGELSGMAMIGPMLSPMIVRNPVTEFFGPMREKSSALLIFCVPEEYAGSTNLLEHSNVTLVYPLMRTKAQFLAAHPEAVETNGLIVAKGKDSGKRYYCAFSKDGKWVASSEVAEFVLPALDEIPVARKPMAGDVVRVFSTELKGLSVGMDVNAQKLDESDKLALAANQQFLKGVKLFEAGLRIDDRGLDVRGRVEVSKDSPLAKIGEATIDGDPFAFAAPDALSAEVLTAGCPARPVSERDWNAIKKFLVRFGLKLDSISVAEKDGVVSTTVDLVRLMKDAKELAKDGKECPIDAVGLCKAISTNETLFAVKTLTKPQRGQAFLKGTKATVSPSVRYAQTLPERVGKPVACASSCSVYEIVRAALPQVVEVFGEGDETLQMLKPLFAALPPAGKGGTAVAAWRENGALHFQGRFAKDEFKSLAAFYQMVAMTAAQANAKARAKNPVAVDDVEEDEDIEECDED